MVEAQTKLATFGSGCFWCSETIFERLKGVLKVTSGYSGGKTNNPTYEEVCSGTTGHAEVVQVEFDPKVISYQLLLDVFFTTHDPTTPNQQGNDIGEQYRSVIFYHDNKQQISAQKKISKLEATNTFVNPIVTEVLPANIFYPAENDQKDYYKNNSENQYCKAVINPKLTKLRKHFELYLVK